MTIDHGLLSPSGKMSKRELKAAQERETQRLIEDCPELADVLAMNVPLPKQPSEKEYLLRRARELRDLAARGMHPRKYLKEAKKLEAKAGLPQ